MLDLKALQTASHAHKMIVNIFLFCYLDCKLAYNGKHFTCFMNYLKSDPHSMFP